MKRLYIDFDGVIMDTIPLLYAEIEKRGVDLSDEKKTREVFATYDFGNIVNDDNILNNSIVNIRKLIESNLFEISILSHINSLNEGVVKVNYLRKYFDEITIILVPRDISKTKMVHSKEAILVDDYSGNLNEWIENGGIAIRFNKDLESKGWDVINDLSKLIDMFKGE